MKIFRALVFVVVAALTSAALFETPASREKEWTKDPWLGFRRTWFFHHFEDYPRQVSETTMLQVSKSEILQSVLRKEARLGKDDEKTEWRTFKYSVRATGVNKDGLPVIEIILDTGATWTAVLMPREKRMILFIAGIYVGRYENDR